MTNKNALHWPSIKAILLEYTICLLCLFTALSFWHSYIVIPCIIVIGIRTHALFVLYHDAVHFQISKNKRINDLVINLFVGVPFLLPIHIYRGFHLSHHNNIGEESDPEILIYHNGQHWNYKALPLKSLLLQFLGDLLFINNIKTVYSYITEKKKLKLVKSKVYPELHFMLLFYLSAIVFAWTKHPVLVYHFIVIWLLPYLTITQLLLKVRSFTEHTFTKDAVSSGSWKRGLMGRLTIWPYNINYHREHHELPFIPWDELPAKFHDAEQRSGSEFWKHIYSGKIV